MPTDENRRLRPETLRQAGWTARRWSLLWT